jgi:diguanylate cyclase
MNPRTDKAMPAGSLPGLGTIARLRPFLAFLRQRLWLLLLWPALALAAVGVLWGLVLSDQEDERRHRQAELAQQVDAYTRSYAIRTRRSVGDTDRLLLLLRHNWAVSGHHTALDGTLEAGIFSRQYIAAVGLIDRNGDVLTSTHPSARGRNVRNQPYFTAPQRTGADRLYLSAPLDSQLTQHEISRSRARCSGATGASMASCCSRCCRLFSRSITPSPS